MASLAQLPLRWRERAAALDRYAPGAGVALREAAVELESALQTVEEVRSARVERAEEFVLSQLADPTRRHTTSELRTAARGRRISNAALARALKVLGAQSTIRFDLEARGAKHWHLARSGE
ncbi:MAG TPA: hypothetical protein VGH98_16730 [Gemmatimonadaceae bacterium]|jgi:hypothetical protein